MNYPFWEVPQLGSAWIIGIIAIFHIPISHFAVGGGIFLPFAEMLAYKYGREEWLPILEKHSKFFLVLTGVFGAVSGVGIWFAIGLVHPEATSTLIHNFVFGWAIEWVFFILELTAAAVYYYTWRRIPKELHLKVGWLYAISSVLTLVIINGILTFMLTPGQPWLDVAGTGQEASRFWAAFFNPTYFPSLVIRIVVCIALAGVWALVTIARLDPDEYGATRTKLLRFSANWLMPMFLLMPLLTLWYYAMIPQQARDLASLGMTTIGSGAFTQITRIALVSIMTTATIAAVVYFFTQKAPRDFTVGHAGAVLFLAVLATATTEYAREAIRKPWVVGNHMYSNGVRKSEVAKFNQEGYLTHSVWKPVSMDNVSVGRAMFRGQCMACHTETGYRSMKGLLGERDSKAIDNVVKMLREAGKADNPYHKYMPPIVGTDAEVAALSDYLKALKGVTPGQNVAVNTHPSP